MRTKYLFPYKSRWIGLILILLHVPVVGYWRKAYPGDDGHGLPLMGGNSLLLSPGHLFFVTTSLLVLVGLFLIAFSKEKIEDEQIGQMRLESLRWAIYFYYFVIVLSIIFTGGIDFGDMLRLSTWVPLLFFIVRFRWVIYCLSE